MEISRDDLNDWASIAVEIESLAELVGQALLDEKIDMAGDLADCTRRLSHLLTQGLLRSGASARDADSNWIQAHGTYLEHRIDRTESSLRAAESLERAALQVIALEKEYGISHGIGETLADFAADLNLLVHGRPGDLD